MGGLKELFYVPKHEDASKVSESALKKSIWTSAVSIIFCMICLVGLSWAWFAAPVVSSENSFESASFDLEITVKAGGVAVTAGQDGTYSLDPEKTYTVTLSKQGTAEKGFCHIKVTPSGSSAATVFCTKEINSDTGTFTLTLKGFGSAVFTPMWGMAPTGAKEVKNNGSIIIQAMAARKTADDEHDEPEQKPDDVEPTASPELETTDEPVQPTPPAPTPPVEIENTDDPNEQETTEPTGEPEQTEAPTPDEETDPKENTE